MIKIGGILTLGLSFMITCAMAQNADLFRTTNPNLINLNEVRSFSDAPLIYIDGVQAPEIATTEMDRIKLQLFGTKNIQKATQNTLQLDETPSWEENQTQDLNFNIETPFHQKTQAGFIQHISDFVVSLQVLDSKQLMVTEQINLVNTEQDLSWQRQIPLPPKTTAQIVGFWQNGQQLIPTLDTETILQFKSPLPLNIGVNSLTFKYLLYNPLVRSEDQATLDLDLTGTQLNWPIERFSVLVFFPQKITPSVSQLLFGTNKQVISEAYQQQRDLFGNLVYTSTRILPPFASIQLDLQFPVDQLPTASYLASWFQNNIFIFLSVLAVLIIYGLTVALWEKKRGLRTSLSKATRHRSLLDLSWEMGTFLTEEKWHLILHFGQQNNLPTKQLELQYHHSRKHPIFMSIVVHTKTFLRLTLEVIIGLFVLIMLAIWGSFISKMPLTLGQIVLLVSLAIAEVFWLYWFVFKPQRKQFWQTQLHTFCQPTFMTGLTVQQVRLLYPLFILSDQHVSWRQQLARQTPQVATQTHLI